jgi:hypothetical protein
MALLNLRKQTYKIIKYTDRNPLTIIRFHVWKANCTYFYNDCMDDIPVLYRCQINNTSMGILYPTPRRKIIPWRY